MYASVLQSESLHRLESSLIAVLVPCAWGQNIRLQVASLLWWAFLGQSSGPP